MSWFDDAQRWLYDHHIIGAIGNAWSGKGTGGDAYSAKSQGLDAPTDMNYHYQFGDYLNGTYSAMRQAQAQAAADYDEWQRNEYSAQQQRAFQEYMDSTKVQRSMADIQAAGLNPWLAVQSAGFGGSTPAAASASSSAGQMASGQGNAGAVASTAVAIAAIVKVIAALAK